MEVGVMLDIALIKILSWWILDIFQAQLLCEIKQKCIPMKYEIIAKDFIFIYKQCWYLIWVLLVIDKRLKGVRFACLGKQIPMMCIFMSVRHVTSNVACNTSVSTLNQHNYHTQSSGWQPPLCMAWCLTWWFASLEKYGQTWHQMSLLRLGVINPHNTGIFYHTMWGLIGPQTKILYLHLPEWNKLFVFTCTSHIIWVRIKK